MKLALEHVSVRFGRVRALDDVSVELEPGRSTVLVGPNGAGKSTLFGSLLGMVRPQHGKLVVDGHSVDLSRRATPFAVRKRLGYLPEAVAFAESLTGRQVLRFFGHARGVSRKTVDEALERVGLAAAARRSVRGYSRGMRQRLGLAIAIVAKPELLVLDEPTGGLDQEGLGLLWDLLGEWRDAGHGVLIATHDLALIERRADTIVVMANGKKLAEGSPEALRQRVGLPVHVRFDLDDNEIAASLAMRLRERFGPVAQDGGRVGVQVPPDDLLTVMRSVNGEMPHVVGTRVEEPGLDQVYDALLREES